MLITSIGNDYAPPLSLTPLLKHIYLYLVLFQNSLSMSFSRLVCLAVSHTLHLPLSLSLSLSLFALEALFSLLLFTSLPLSGSWIIPHLSLSLCFSKVFSLFELVFSLPLSNCLSIFYFFAVLSQFHLSLGTYLNSFKYNRSFYVYLVYVSLSLEA